MFLCDCGKEFHSNNKFNKHKNKCKYSLKFIELCSGCGGLSNGLINAGFTPLLLNDIDKNCCDTLRKNHSDVNIVCCPMEELNLDEYKGVDLLVAGIPCQPFSLAGTRKGFADKRNLVIQFINIVKKIKPKMFLIENVKGLVLHNSGKTMETIINLLTESGEYEVKYRVLNAVNFDVPQKRERVFIIGALKELNISIRFPKANNNEIVLKDVLKNVPKSLGAKYSKQKKDLFKMIPQGGCWVNLPKQLQKEYLGKSYNSGGGKRGILRRLSMNEPSLTLLCSPAQKMTERCHPLYNRPLTIREYARIQTFSDEYEFTGSVSSQYKQIGNAVPVLLAERIGKCIKKYIIKSYKNNNITI